MGCSCLSETVTGATQRTLEAWIQVRGASPKHEMQFAMTDGDLQGIRVSQWTKKFRGSRTPINRRTYAHESKQCGAKEGAKSANSISIDVAACGCGDVDLVDLMNCRQFDLYQTEVCCEGEGGSFVTGWNKVRVWTNVSFDEVSSNSNVSFDVDDDNDIVYTYPGDFTDSFVIYDLGFTEITSGLSVDFEMTDVSYGCSSCASCGDGCEACVESWVAISATGKVAYQQNSYDGPKATTITGWPLAAVAGYITLYNNYYWAIARVPGGSSKLFKAYCSTPTVWTEVTTLSIPTLFEPYGIECTRNNLIVYGNCGVSGLVYDLANNQVLDKTDFCMPTETCSLTFGGYSTLAICDKRLALPADDCNNVTGNTTAMAFRGSEIWRGNDIGGLEVSYDYGATFSTVLSFPSGTGTIKSVAWANANVGYVVRLEADGSYGLYTTVNGGNLWSTNDRAALPTGAVVNKLVVPCCRSDNTTNSNRVLVAGSIKGRAAVWQGAPQKC